MRNFFILGLACCLGLSSCDILDVNPVSTITSESFWKNPSDAKAYLTGIYNKVRSLYNTSYYGEDRGDAFKPGEIGPVSVAWSQQLLESNAPSYRNAYSVIHHTNLLFYNIDNLQFSNEKDKNDIKAQCYFLRAYTYFLLLRSWGEVPIVNQPTLSDDIIPSPRASKDEVVKFILDDLEKSISLFQENGFVDKNIASKPAAYALRADVFMWKAKVLNGGKEDFLAAISDIDKVEESGVELLSEYSEIFKNDNKKNKEIIFSFYFERYETGNLYVASNLTSRTDNLSMAVNLVDAATSPNQSRHVYAPSDKLRKLYLENSDDKRYCVAMIDLVDASGKLILTQQNKFRGKQYSDDLFFDDDLIAYRWGDLLLLRAEANAALNNLEKSLYDLNKIRNRAGLSNYSGSMDKLSIEKELCDERFRELFLEQKRWFDLLRFHFGGTINIYNEVPNLKDKPNYPLYLPINYNDMVLNDKLLQTEGYESNVKR